MINVQIVFSNGGEVPCMDCRIASPVHVAGCRRLTAARVVAGVARERVDQMLLMG